MRSSSFVRRDLAQRLRAHVRPFAVAGVPGHGGVERGREVPARRPAEPLARERAVEPQHRRLAARRPPAARRGPPACRASARAAARRPSRPGARPPRPGPKFHAPPGVALAAAARRPSGSPRAGTARAATGAPRPGARSVTGSPASAARMQSATSRSGAQSPPPITLPARTVASGSPSARYAVGDVLLRGLGGRVGVLAAERVVLAERASRRRRCGSTCRSSRPRRRAARPRRAPPRAPSPCRSR